MINSEKFAVRLKKIMEYYQISASAFADRIRVPRSSISHLLSGRNKPSLDFVMKVIREFEDVELYWLLNGKGHFPNQVTSTPSVHQKKISVQRESDPLPERTETNKMSSKKIERIVIFYADGTFKEYIQ